MKKCVTVLLAAALLCLIWVPAWAAEAEEDGIYDISSEEVITSLRTAEGAAAASVADEDFGTYYPGAARFNVVCSGTDIGKDYTVFVVAGDEEPNSTNLVYIDQKTAAGGTVTFDVYPALKRGDYSVHVTGGSAVLSTTSPWSPFS